MRLPRFRFTVRRMMVAVAIAAIAAVGLGVTVAIRRAAASSVAARDHAWNEDLYRSHAAMWRRGPGKGCINLADMSPAGLAAGVAWADRLAAHHAALRAKHERAARYPWLPVAPDPPEPK